MNRTRSWAPQALALVLLLATPAAKSEALIAAAALPAPASAAVLAPAGLFAQEGSSRLSWSRFTAGLASRSRVVQVCVVVMALALFILMKKLT